MSGATEGAALNDGSVLALDVCGVGHVVDSRTFDEGKLFIKIS